MKWRNIGAARTLGLHIEALSGQPLNEPRTDWRAFTNRIGWFVSGAATSYIAMALLQLWKHGI